MATAIPVSIDNQTRGHETDVAVDGNVLSAASVSARMAGWHACANWQISSQPCQLAEGLARLGACHKCEIPRRLRLTFLATMPTQKVPHEELA